MSAGQGMGAGVPAHLRIHNLDVLDMGFFLVVVILLGVGVSSFVGALRQVNRRATPTP